MLGPRLAMLKSPGVMWQGDWDWWMVTSSVFLVPVQMEVYPLVSSNMAGWKISNGSFIRTMTFKHLQMIYFPASHVWWNRRVHGMHPNCSEAIVSEWVFAHPHGLINIDDYPSIWQTNPWFVTVARLGFFGSVGSAMWQQLLWKTSEDVTTNLPRLMIQDT